MRNLDDNINDENNGVKELDIHDYCVQGITIDWKKATELYNKIIAIDNKY